MDKYLLDTNAFFEMLSFLAGKNVRRDGYDYEDIKKGECYISKLTELEIISVIGKYRRGEPAQWQKCDRMISLDETRCNHNYYNKGKKPWNNRLCRDLHKLVKEILQGKSSVFKVNVLELDEEIINRAEVFMMYSSKFNFGSQDALIAATALVNSEDGNVLQVVTSDRGLRAAMKEEGMAFVVPGSQPVVECVRD